MNLNSKRIVVRVSVLTALAVLEGTSWAQDAPSQSDAAAAPMVSPDAGAPAPTAAGQADDAALDVIPLPDDAPATPAVSPDAPAPSNIATVVVTAQRREENIQDVPISITVFNQEQITKANMTNSADLALYTPALSANTRFGAENATFTIRGFTQDLRTTASVGTYFAEVIAPRGQSTQGSGDGAGPGALFDLQNVQVLKGPQGTLFGRNTTGGAILIVPQKPTDAFGGYAEMSIGDFDLRQEQAVVNVPFGDAFRVRLGVDHKQRDGHLTNVTGVGADKLGDVDYTAGRLSAVWNITDTVENYSILSMVNSATKGYTAGLYACDNPIRNLSTPSEYDVQTLINGLVNSLATGSINLADPVPGVPVGSPFALLTFMPCMNQLARQQAAGQGGFYDVASTVKDPATDLKERRFINTTTWKIADQIDFKNIVAYAHLFTRNDSSIFGTHFPGPTDTTGNREFSIGQTMRRPDIPLTSQETWVEEMQLQGESFGHRLQWQGGLYYESSTPDGYSGSNSASFIYCDLASLQGDPSKFDCVDPYLGVLGGVLHYQVKTKYLNRAVYAQGTYSLLDSLSVTMGLRYTWDETEGHGIKTLYRYLLSVPQAPATEVQTPKIKSSAPTGMLELSYYPWDRLMTYAKYTRGYRQGNVNMLADPGLDTHKPEYVNTYEVGFKGGFDWPIRGTFDTAVFYNELTDMQLQGGYISRSGGPTTAIFNAGKAWSRGFEIESSLQPFDLLTINLSYSLLDTKLVKSADFCGRVQQVGLIEGLSCTPIADVGDDLPFAPKSSYVANLTWALPVPTGFGGLSFGVTYAYTGKQRVAASSSSPYAVLDDFGVLNLNLDWTGLLATSCDFSLFMTNVTDEQYVTYTSGTYRTLGFESRAVGLPRMMGARLRYNFGS
ncbi:TonB-dependent receptor [Solimonas terrae]|uniref:TonB-dependent receptor n=1 Tax=Solimonas terrae TaxID=1396819 RepID=A0A6M2BU93_9GAMM|nr:TonB-dependent receptor [Solimonas terrae]